MGRCVPVAPVPEAAPEATPFPDPAGDADPPGAAVRPAAASGGAGSRKPAADFLSPAESSASFAIETDVALV